MFVTLTVDAQDEPRITMEIWPEIKRVGMTGYLNCTVTRQSNNKVCHSQIVTSVKQAIIVDGYDGHNSIQF